MRILGLLLFVAACAGTTACVKAAFEQPRPRDLGWALLAPVALAAALCGALLMFVPGFLG